MNRSAVNPATHARVDGLPVHLESILMLATLKKQLTRLEQMVGVSEDAPLSIIEGYDATGQYRVFSAIWQQHGRWNFWNYQSGKEYPPELKLRYRELFGEDSPSGNRQHLFRRVAWRLQAQAAGGLSERARERSTQLAQEVELRLRAPREFWNELSVANTGERDAGRDPRVPPIGTSVSRIYQGQTITATVLPEGFGYAGRIYRSLSAIACHVTGTRWNGLLFFGLIQRNGRN